MFWKCISFCRLVYGDSLVWALYNAEIKALWRLPSRRETSSGSVGKKEGGRAVMWSCIDMKIKMKEAVDDFRALRVTSGSYQGAVVGSLMRTEATHPEKYC